MPNTKKRSNALIDLLVERPIWILSILLVVAAALATQAPRFEINASAETLLTKDNEIYLRTQQANRRFAPQEFLLIAYRPLDHALLSEETFTDLDALSAELRQLPRVQSVRSILNVPLLSLAGDGLSGDLDPNEWTIDSGGFTIEQIEAALTDHPIFEDLLVNSDFSATAIQVTFRRDENLEALQNQIIDLQEARRSGTASEGDSHRIEELEAEAKPLQQELERIRTQEIEAIRAMAADYQDRAELLLGGAHALGYELINIIKSDLVLFGIAIFVIISLTLALIFRELKWALIPIACCLVSVSATLGILALLGLQATVISANFIALQLILTIAIALHLIVQFIELQDNDPEASVPDMLKATLRLKAAPCFYSGLTTSVGFASLIFSGLQPVISFGYMMIIAIAVSIIVSLILFPAAIALFARRQKPRSHRIADAALSSSAGFVLTRGRIIVGTTFAIVILGTIGALLLDVENSFLHYFRESTQTRKELAFIDQEFGGSTPLDVIYDLPDDQRDPDLVLTAEAVQSLQRIQAMLESQTGVGKALSLVNFTELARNINRGRPLTEYELAALYSTLDQDLRDDLLGSFFSAEHGQARISLRIIDTTEGLNRADLMASIRSSMADLEIDESEYQLTSLFVLYQDILQRLFRSQILTAGLVLAALTLAFWAIFRSLRVALVAIVPNIVSTLFILGLMGLLGIPLDLMTITIASIAMGIAVDDTIHYIHRFLDERQGNDSEKAIRNTHASVGHAILYTSLVIMLGFSALSFSDFIPSVLFGLLTALSIFAALLCDLFLLPVLLRRFLPPDRTSPV